MNSLVWLGVTLVLVVAAVLTGNTPRGGKPVARTGLMKAARGVLILGIIACGVLGLGGLIRN